MVVKSYKLMSKIDKLRYLIKSEIKQVKVRTIDIKINWTYKIKSKTAKIDKSDHKTGIISW